jgi:hypothetical protein
MEPDSSQFVRNNQSGSGTGHHFQTGAVSRLERQISLLGQETAGEGGSQERALQTIRATYRMHGVAEVTWDCMDARESVLEILRLWVTEKLAESKGHSRTLKIASLPTFGSERITLAQRGHRVAPIKRR